MPDATIGPSAGAGGGRAEASADVTVMQAPGPADGDATVLGSADEPADGDATVLGAPAVTAGPQGEATVLAERDLTVLADTDATRLGDHRPTVPASSRLRPPSTSGLGGRPPRGTSLTPPRTGRAGGSSAAQGDTGPLEVGQAFGPRYHIIRLLGMGGMGAVYQAWDAELEVALALKVIRPDATDDPIAAAEIERRFKRELLLARQVTHRNVVRIHDLGEIDGIKYITMPYVEGDDLASVLAAGTLPVPRALRIAKQVASGLEAAHSAGVVHRDLKPANVMVTAEDEALIMDFGIARSSSAAQEALGGRAQIGATRSGDEGATRVGTVMGTLEYMAPEQARGEHVDHRADIYAFGMILYRMLVGRRFAPGATDALTDLTARMKAEPTRLREIDATVPEAIEAVVSKCLQPDAAARYQTTTELVAALDGLDEQGVPLPPPPRLLTSWRFWAAAAAAMVLLVAATWFIAEQVRIPATTVERDPVAVLVSDFANRTGEAVFDGLLEPTLTVGIESASFISAYQRSSAARAARELNAGERLDEEAARLVAVREGLKLVLAGAIEKKGSGYAVSLRGIEPTSGKVLFTESEDAADREAVLRATADLAASVRSELGDTRAADPKEAFSAASLEAASAYTRAQELSSAGRDAQAIELFREATERDPAFGRAYGGWAMSATRLGRREEAEDLWKQALSQLERMTERERYRLLGAYYTVVTRNYDKALETYATLVRLYPADGAGHNNLAVGHFRRLEFQKAMDEGQRVLQIYPNSALYRTNHALYAMYAGRFDIAVREARRLVEQGQATFDAYLPIAVGAIAEGKPDDARAAYEQMATVGRAGASLAAVGLADLALFAGRPGDAIETLRAGITADEQDENPAGVAAKLTALADALGMSGDRSGAIAAANRALAIDQTEAQIIPAVRWLIAAGKVDEAARLGEELDNRLETQARAYGRIVAGQVALARGKRVDAVDALREAVKLADVWLARFHLGLTYLDAGYFAEALSEFEACQKRRGEGFAVFLDDMPSTRYVPPLDYWVGRAREGLGLVAQAQANYRDFIAGRAADSPDPLLKDARKRLGS